MDEPSPPAPDAEARPSAPGPSCDPESADTPESSHTPAARPLATLKRRAEFLACARGRNAHTAGMVVQARPRAKEPSGGASGAPPGGPTGVRVGFTTSRKVGKAVARNRARRRLREVARRVLPERGRDGWDYVLIARAGATVSRPFARLVADLERALERLHGEHGR